MVDEGEIAAVIDRVGKYQLSMQRVCSYKPFAASMPPMLREEAFHLAAGVIPMRRWMEAAARDRNDRSLGLLMWLIEWLILRRYEARADDEEE